jgi:NhaP-type Na+/H+ or K+/H+ antiporter
MQLRAMAMARCVLPVPAPPTRTILRCWPTASALVFGALISAIDPVAIIAMFKDDNVHGRVRLLVETESLMNDGAAAVLFVMAVAWAQSGGQGQSGLEMIVMLARIVLGVLATVTTGLMICNLGALDMGIANLLGSNLFNMLVLAIDDIAYRPGSLFAAASQTHAVTAFAAVIMSGIVIVALYRPSTRFFGAVGWTGLSLSTVYFLASYVIYLHGH